MDLAAKLDQLEDTFADIERQISDPEVISDQDKYQALLKKHSDIKEGVDSYRSFKTVEQELADAKELLSDPEMKEMAEVEIPELESRKKALEDELQIFLLPKDPNDDKNAIVEIRQGTGGDEAALFAYDLYRMYTRYAEKQRWSVQVLSETLTGLKGVKEIAFLVTGNGAYSYLKFESGTHRVQRVPDTESSGRIHTSAATVAIMPEVDDDVDVSIEQKDLRIDVYRASGAGGQHVNKTSSAVRITHLPTGVVVACQDERSQFQNKDKAMRVLKSKLYDMQVEEQRKANADLRKNQVGSGDRSEKIRTYNFPQNRLTDHRINFTSHSMLDVLEGNMDDVIEALIKADRLAKMQAE
jgi:peptide chain release factor 1